MGGEPTFVNYFLTHHPVLGLFWFDDHDPIRGYRRRAVLLGVFLLTFAFTVFKEAAINHVFRINYHDDDDALESTRKDMVELSRGYITYHLIVTLVVAFLAFLIEHFVVWFFGLPSREGCQTCWCCLCRTVIRLSALVVLLFCIAIGIFLAVGNKSEVFVGWLYSYALYACILAPIKLIIFWRCCVREWQRDRAMDEKLAQQMRLQYQQKQWAAARAVAAAHPTQATHPNPQPAPATTAIVGMPRPPAAAVALTHGTAVHANNGAPPASPILFHPPHGIGMTHNNNTNGHKQLISGGNVVIHVGASH